MISDAKEFFTKDCINDIKEIIAKNNYNEVVFVGNLSREGLVSDIEPITYGNENAAPVIMMDALQGDVLIHNHPSIGKEKISNLLRPSEADISIASELANKRIGFYIIDNNCEWVNIVNKPEPRYYLNNTEVLSIFESGGLIEKNISNFESRKEQVELVRLIIQTINDSKILISEAGTGTGKSLSYLIPITIWAVMNKKRVIVSTQTKNLQQQIAQKDMLIVEKIIKNYLDKPLYYSVLIGRNNYLCKYKLEELMKDNEKRESLFEEESDIQTLLSIKEWSERTQDGIITETDLKIKEEIREEISSEGESCQRKKCQFYNNCFYYKARMEAEKSNLIIANHSLVFSSIDEESKRISLPFFSGIVFDEAHHIEDNALKSLAKDFSIQSINYHLRKIFHYYKDREIGLLPLLFKKAGLYYLEFEEKYKQLISLVNEISKQLNNFLKENIENTGTQTIDAEFIQSIKYKTLLFNLEDIIKNINKFTGFFQKFEETIVEKTSNPSAIDTINYIKYRIRRIEELESIFNLIFKTENEINFVKWIETSKKNIKFCYSPLEVGDFIANSIFSKKDFTIFTSATLSISGKFDFFKNSVGLPLVTNKEKIEAIFPSPFDYDNQALILILNKNLEHHKTSQEKLNLIKELTLISEGGTLILYTSYKRMNESFELLRDAFINAGLVVGRQGNESRNILLKKMREINNYVLFATSSFWEGIDIRGDNLRMVIIEKIPFDSVDDPLYNAKVKLLEYKGLNPFISYSLPRAILKLKQGMGRLIRSKSDKGIITILDNRIIHKSYSKSFINSIPGGKIIIGDERTLLNEAEDFFINKF
ncbi:MAG: DEAD/DEAH box helicase family protein [Brevinematales bacterium]|nr:DEAD/DEAH box helicase family protein [Brevinematales bacterium]